MANAGWELKDVAPLRALALASVRFALDVALIYLALRGLESVLERRRRGRDARTEAADRPREEGGDGRGPDHH